MADEYKQLTESELHDGIRIGDISEMGSAVPPGRSKIRLSRIEGKPSASSATPMVIAGFDVLDGQPAPDKDGKTPNIESIKGLELQKRFTLWVGKSESGRTIAPGIMEAKATFAAVGSPMNDDDIFPGNVREAAKLVHDRLVRKDLEAVVYREADRKKPEKIYTQVRIIGLWNGAPSGVEMTATAGASGSNIV